MYKKRGQSNVVSTVLIILLVVAAVAIIGVILLNVINKSGATISATALCNDVAITPVSCTYNNTNTYGLFNVKLSQNITIVNATITNYNQRGDTVVKVIPGNGIGNLQTVSFLIAQNNTLNPSSKLGMYAVIRANGGTTAATCPQSITVPCNAVINYTGQQGTGQIPGSNTTTYTDNGNSTNSTLTQTNSTGTSNLAGSFNGVVTSAMNGIPFYNFTVPLSGGTFVANGSAIPTSGTGVSLKIYWTVPPVNGGSTYSLQVTAVENQSLPNGTWASSYYWSTYPGNLINGHGSSISNIIAIPGSNVSFILSSSGSFSFSNVKIQMLLNSS